MRIVLLCAVVISAAGPMGPAIAGTPYEEEITCPIGGEKFKHISTGSYSTFRSRPDGKPYGSWTFPMPIPVCPSNNLPIYDEFSKELLAKLKPLVASAEFKALANDKPYYRASWLMGRSGAPTADVAWMLVKASWEANDDLPLKRKYQEAYVAKLLAIPKDAEPSEWLWLQARAANGLRELGRFQQSVALIDALTPQAKSALEKARAAKEATTKTDDAEEKLESTQYLVEYLGQLRAVTLSENSRSEPVAMLSVEIAQGLCEEKKAELSASDLAACKTLPAARR